MMEKMSPTASNPSQIKLATYKKINDEINTVLLVLLPSEQTSASCAPVQ